MAVTQNTYTGNGTTVLYSFTFPYLDTSHIKVSINGTLTTAYTLANATTIQFTTAPANGAAIRIYRETDDATLQSTFFAGSAIRAQDLNEDFNQSLYIAQETKDRNVDPNNATLLNDLNMNGYRITSLGSPTASTDAANKAYTDNVILGQIPDGTLTPAKLSTGRPFWNSSGNVGIGTTSPAYKLDVTGGGIGINTSAGTAASVVFNQSGIAASEIGLQPSDSSLIFKGWTGAALAERMRIDSSGRMLVGTTAARSNFFNTTSFAPQFQLEGTGTAQILSVTSSDTVYGPYLVLARQKSGSVGGNTLVGNNDLLGSVDFQGSDGTKFIAGGQIKSEVDGTPGANDMPGRLVFSTTADGASSPTERMRIDSSGRVGIGTSSPSSLLHVGGVATPTVSATPTSIRLDNTYTGSPAAGNKLKFYLYNDGSEYYGLTVGDAADFQYWAGGGSSGTHRWFTSNTERMRVNSAGALLVGTATHRNTTRFVVEADGTNGSATFYQPSTVSYTAIFLNNPNGVVGSISTSGSTTAYNTSSDYRLKENIEPVADGITRLKQLNPSRFNFKTDPDHTVDGFIAHEVQAVVPEAITGEKDAEDDDGNPIYQGIDQSKLVPLLTAALQEAIAKIETLEARLAALEAA